jgi:hypothetical protein
MLKKLISENKIYQRYKEKKHAKQLSLTSKRLDVTAAQMAHLFSLNKNLSVKDKVCLEIGGGWVLSHALIMYLMGAKKILVTDIESIANPEFIPYAINSSSLSLIRDILSPYEDHEILRARLNKLHQIKNYNFEELQKLDIEYKAPVNFDRKILPEKFDFIFSNVVLEYLTEDSLLKLVMNLKQMLNPKGEMLHAVHLEDHASSKPFDYLKTDTDFYTAAKYLKHSNRIRFSTYNTVFSASGLDFSYLYQWERKDAALPQNIDPNIKYTNENDLRTSHFCVYMKNNILLNKEE